MTLTIDHESLRLLAAHDDPMTRDHIKRFTALNSELANFLKPMALQDFIHERWDFRGDSVMDDFFTFDADAGAVEFAPASPQVRGGAIKGSTGAVSGEGLSAIGAGIVDGDHVAILKARFQVDVISNLSFEIGFVDAVTDRTLPVITDVDTPASGNGGSDIAVVHMDTAQTLKTMAFVTDGSTSGMACTKENLGTLIPTANVPMDVMVAVYGNNALCNINGKRVYRKVIPNSIEGGTLLRPWIYFRTRSTAAKAPIVDFVELFGGR